MNTSDDFEIFLATAPGLEAALREEALAHGFKRPTAVRGGVALHGGWRDVWRANLAIRGTSIFYRSQIYGGFWRGSVTGFGLPRPGQLIVFAINAVRKGPKAEEELEISHQQSRRILSEDQHIMDTIRYRVGYLTKGDRSLAKFLTYVRKYPRAHPSAEFIN